MKKRFPFVLACLLVFTSAFSAPISLQKAKSIAASFMRNGNMPVCVQTTLTRNIDNETPPLYIFNRGDNQGFVIISGDDCMPQILGYTESGDFELGQMPPALLDLIAGYEEVIENAQSAGVSTRTVTRSVNTKTDIAPLVTAHWHQSSPYNDLCPFITNTTNRALTGCVATAAAQVAYYWRKDNPERTGEDTPTYDYGAAPVTESTPKGTPLLWGLMQDSYGSSTPADMKEAVATLMVVTGTSTWLTYGSSTSGQISNLVNTFNTQFNLRSTCTYKSGISQDDWEDMIYDNLSQGLPIVYSGVHPTNGGHAVVLDGYKSSDNLFHFNFGWGGQGDGYYTVNDVNGMNGFNGQQGMVHDIQPKSFKVEGNILDWKIYKRMNSTITVSATNNGSAIYSGFYLFAETRSTTLPSNINDAEAKNITDVIAPGETKTVTLTYKPTRSGTTYLFLTDKNCRLLDSLSIQVTDQTPDLTLNSFTINTNNENSNEEISIDGTSSTIPVLKVYNDNMIKAVANITNSENASYTAPSISCQLNVYNTTSQSFTKVDRINNSEYTFESGETNDVEYIYEGLDTESLYSIEFSPIYQASNQCEMNVNNVQTVLYFRLAGNSLNISKTSDYHVKVTGKWDEMTFMNLANDETIATYDLTEVTGEITRIPSVANPNALFYVKDNSTLSGTNIIKGNTCDELILQSGYNFVPLTDFTATKATFKMNHNGLQWIYAAIPFNCQLPASCMARRINELVNLTIKADSSNTSISKCTPYLFKTCSTAPVVFYAENADISTTAAPDLNDERIKCTFVNMEPGNLTRALNRFTTQEFASTTSTIPAFSGYIEYDNNVSISIFTYNSKDTETNNLGNAILSARDITTAYEHLVNADTYNKFIQQIESAESAFTLQASKSDITAATETLDEAIVTLKKQQIFNGTPIDYTEIYLANPSFESSSRTPTDWDVESQTGQLKSILDMTDIEKFLAGSEGSNAFYSYSNTGKGSVSISQQINDLPNGLYRLTAMLGTEEGKTVTLFAGNKEANLVGDDFGPRYLHKVVVDSIEVEDATLVIGINGNDSWYKADNFRLYYIGGTTTGIKDVTVDHQQNNDVSIEVRNRTVCVTSSTGNPVLVSVFNLSGQNIHQIYVSDTETFTLPTGIYLINRQKIVIK